LAPANSSGPGSDIFGDNANTFEASSLCEPAGSPSDDSVLTTAMAGVALEESGWIHSPFFSATYLSTMTECLPPATSKSSHDVQIDVVDAEAGKDVSWNLENYEDSLQVDRVFEVFSKRVGYQSGQCVRYVITGLNHPVVN
jgi:pre-rRNA-processing protein TSR4